MLWGKFILHMGIPAPELSYLVRALFLAMHDMIPYFFILFFVVLAFSEIFLSILRYSKDDEMRNNFMSPEFKLVNIFEAMKFTWLLTLG